MNKYDFAIGYHRFRLYNDDGTYRLRSIVIESKKKGKKTIETERESVEISSPRIDTIKKYILSYFNGANVIEIEETMRELEHKLSR